MIVRGRVLQDPEQPPEPGERLAPARLGRVQRLGDAGLPGRSHPCGAGLQQDDRRAVRDDVMQLTSDLDALLVQDLALPGHVARRHRCRVAIAGAAGSLGNFGAALPALARMNDQSAAVWFVNHLGLVYAINGALSAGTLVGPQSGGWARGGRSLTRPRKSDGRPCQQPVGQPGMAWSSTRLSARFISGLQARSRHWPC